MRFSSTKNVHKSEGMVGQTGDDSDNSVLTSVLIIFHTSYKKVHCCSGVNSTHRELISATFLKVIFLRNTLSHRSTGGAARACPPVSRLGEERQIAARRERTAGGPDVCSGKSSTTSPSHGGSSESTRDGMISRRRRTKYRQSIRRAW